MLVFLNKLIQHAFSYVFAVPLIWQFAVCIPKKHWYKKVLFNFFLFIEYSHKECREKKSVFRFLTTHRLDVFYKTVDSGSILGWVKPMILKIGIHRFLLDVQRRKGQRKTSAVSGRQETRW